MHFENSFITLTYDDQHLPKNGSLDHTHFQKFLKRLRKELGDKKIRYYMAGEYGDKSWRPHYHALIFGHDFADDRYYWTQRKGNKYYRSPLLERCWTMGMSDVSNFTYANAAYVARYVSKKITGNMAEEHYQRIDENGEPYQLQPEYNRMSNRPGIGSSWFDRYRKEVFPCDEIVINGKKYPVPKYYERKWMELCPTGHAFIKRNRYRKAMENSAAGERTPERRMVKEACHKKRFKNERNLNQ